MMRIIFSNTLWVLNITATLCLQKQAYPQTLTDTTSQFIIINNNISGINEDGILEFDTSRIRHKNGVLFKGTLAKYHRDRLEWTASVNNGMLDGIYTRYTCSPDSASEPLENNGTKLFDTTIYDYKPYHIDSLMIYMLLNQETKSYIKYPTKIVEQGNYHNNLREGVFIKYDKNNLPIEILTYQKGKLHGTCYFSKGYFHVTLTEFINGQKNGNESIYLEKTNWPREVNVYQNAKIIQKQSYHQLKNKISQKVIFKNGKIEKKYHYDYDASWNLQLTTIENIESGLKINESIDEDGHRTQSYSKGRVTFYTTFYDNDQIKSKFQSTIDNQGKYRIIGNLYSYYETGKLEMTIPYQKGMINGLAIQYYENGKVKSRTTMQNDKANGPFYAYYENGKLAEKCNHKNGEIDGTFYKYNELGQLMNIYYYKNGTQVR
jgi:antitoxin component YwqK of YwqJK toxin-antitoxin module